MESFKVKFTFVRIGEARFGTKAEMIVTALTNEPMLTLVTDPTSRGWPTRAAMKRALADYLTAQHHAADGSRWAIRNRIQARRIMEGMLKDFAPQVEVTAKAANDLSILVRSGYDLRRPNVRQRTNGVPDAPRITVRRGPVSQSVVVRSTPAFPRGTACEAEYAVGDSVNFQGRVVSARRSRITFTGLELAKLHQFRLRGMGREGPGDWSAPARIIVT